MWHCLTFGTKYVYFGPIDNLFRGQKADFGTSGGPKRASFALKMTVWEPLIGPEWAKNGSGMLTQLKLASWTIM